MFDFTSRFENHPVALNLATQFSLRARMIVNSDAKIYIDLDDTTEEFYSLQTLNGPMETYIRFSDITDNVGNLYSISGGERVLFSLGTPAAFSEYSAIVTKMICSDTVSRKYDMELRSPAWYTAEIPIIQRAYRGKKKASEIVTDILKSVFHLDDAVFFVEESETELEDFVVPNWTLMELVSWMRKYVKPKESNSPYFFFECARGIYFASLDSLFKLFSSEIRGYEISLSETTDGSSYGTRIVFDDENLNLFDHDLNLKKGSLGVTREMFDENEKKVVFRRRFLDKRTLGEVRTVGKNSVYRDVYPKQLSFYNYHVHNEGKDTIDQACMTDVCGTLLSSHVHKIYVLPDLTVTPGTIVALRAFNKDGTIASWKSGAWIVGKVEHQFRLRGSRGDHQRNNEAFTALTLYRDSYYEIPETVRLMNELVASGDKVIA